jgi:alpha-galactosidase
MLATGEQGLTIDEQKTHFALWCVMSSPLILGNDPRVMTKAEKEILLNRECIAINQDPTEQGKRVNSSENVEIWVKQLKGGEKAVLVLNRNKDGRNNFAVDLGAFGIKGKSKNKGDI